MNTSGVSAFLQNPKALATLLYLYHYNPNVPVQRLAEGIGITPSELSEFLNLAIRFNLAEIEPTGEVNLSNRGAFIIKAILEEAGAPTQRILA